MKLTKSPSTFPAHLGKAVHGPRGGALPGLEPERPSSADLTARVDMALGDLAVLDEDVRGVGAERAADGGGERAERRRLLLGAPAPVCLISTDRGKPSALTRTRNTTLPSSPRRRDALG